MDVNGVGQNINTINTYSNSKPSEYTQTNTEAAVTKVKPVEVQVSTENQNNEKKYNKRDLDDAIKKINNFMKDEHTHAEYSVHKDFGTIMIKIVNEDTKEVLLEVPPQKMLDMVASMCRQFGLLDRKA